MDTSEREDRAAQRKAARDRVVGPVAGPLRRAGLLSVASALIWPAQAACVAWVISGWVSGQADMTATVMAAALFLAGALLRALLDHRAGAILFDAAEQTVERERAALLRREARAPGPERSAAIAALLVQKLPALRPWITRYFVAMTKVSVVPPILLIVAFSQSWAVGLILLVAGPLIPVFMALVGMAAEDASRRHLDEISTMNDMLMDRVSAMQDIRLLGAVDRAVAGFDDRADALRIKTMAVLRIAFLSSTVLELFAALGVAMIAVFIGFSLLGEIGFGSWDAPITLGQGVFLLLIAPEFFQPLRELAAAWHDRAAGLSVVAELEALDAAPRAGMVGKGEARAPLPGALSIRLSGARVAMPALLLPDLTLEAGEAVVLTGPSGSGKTTTLAVLAGLVPLSEGCLEVCGASLSEQTADAWRARLAMIPQRPHFGSMTLRTFLDPRDSGADPWSALDLAHARGIVERLPDGLDTRLGETGGGVSGGEARRLMIARAVMAGGDLLLADEPTADLDADTARRVIDALQSLHRQGRAMIVATHDPALIAAMGRVVVMPR